MGKELAYILLVEDSPSDQRLVKAYMSDLDPPSPTLHFADRLQTALQTVSARRYDLVLLDLTLPDSFGLDTFRRLRKQVPNLPVIVLTALDGEEHALEALKIGAEDYLVKDQIDGRQLARCVRYALERAARRQLERRLADSAASERSQVGSELHDNVGQKLTGLTLMAQSLKGRLEGSAPHEAAYAGEMAAVAKDALAQARTLARGLSPVEMLDEGLMVALQELAHRTSNHFSTQCVFECRQPVSIKDNEISTQLYMIAQEAVSNAVQHGGGIRITIRLVADNDQLALTVDDDGVGFRQTQVNGHGMGHRIMRHRASRVGGTFDMQERSGGGTCVACTIADPNRG
jgi:signal transduction histidine kinase